MQELTLATERMELPLIEMVDMEKRRLEGDDQEFCFGDGILNCLLISKWRH